MMNLYDGERVTDIREFEGIYAVTDQGRVWSYRRNKWLALCKTDKGYSVVSLSVSGKEVVRKIHRLVGVAFVKNPHDKKYINHKNGDKADCHYKNLEWVTATENNQHACDNKLNSHFKLSKKDKHLVCQIFKNCDVTKSYLSRLYKLTPAGIDYIIKAYGDQVGHA